MLTTSHLIMPLVSYRSEVTGRKLINIRWKGMPEHGKWRIMGPAPERKHIQESGVSTVLFLQALLFWAAIAQRINNAPLPRRSHGKAGHYSPVETTDTHYDLRSYIALPALRFAEHCLGLSINIMLHGRPKFFTAQVRIVREKLAWRKFVVIFHHADVTLSADCETGPKFQLTDSDKLLVSEVELRHVLDFNWRWYGGFDVVIMINSIDNNHFWW